MHGSLLQRTAHQKLSHHSRIIQRPEIQQPVQRDHRALQVRLLEIRCGARACARALDQLHLGKVTDLGNTHTY
jgi:hypothetical protein